MLCPRCASNQSDEIKFCTFCGANLQAVRDALAAPEATKKFDWSETWVAEMFMSAEAQERRKLEMERRMGITPEIKRYQEIKAGVILSCIGVGIAIFLAIFMQGIIPKVEPDTAEILSRLWIAGVLPFMIGLALMINGAVVSKKLIELQERKEREKGSLEEAQAPRGLRAADTSEFIPAGMSVTEGTTRHLQSVEQEKNPRKIV
jgi:hypothetical protein